MKILYGVGIEAAYSVVQVCFLTGKAGKARGGCSLGEVASGCTVSWVLLEAGVPPGQSVAVTTASSSQTWFVVS